MIVVGSRCWGLRPSRNIWPGRSARRGLAIGWMASSELAAGQFMITVGCAPQAVENPPWSWDLGWL